MLCGVKVDSVVSNCSKLGLEKVISGRGLKWRLPIDKLHLNVTKEGLCEACGNNVLRYRMVARRSKRFVWIGIRLQFAPHRPFLIIKLTS